MHARVGEEQRHHIARDFPGLDNLHRRETKTLLVNLGRERHRAGRHPADIRVMRAIRRECERPLLVTEENRRDQRQIGQMSAARERIIERGDVAGKKFEALDRGAHRKRRRSEMHRNMRGLRDQLAAPIEQRARKIVTLLDVGGEAGHPEHHAHLLGDRGEAIVHNCERDRHRSSCAHLQVEISVSRRRASQTPARRTRWNSIRRLSTVRRVLTPAPKSSLA